MQSIRIFLLALLLLAIPATTTQAAAILSEHAQGQEVIRLQKELIRTGYLKSPADGVFGESTKAAVLAFQRDEKLDATGIVNRTTWQRLKLAKTTSSPSSNVNIAMKPSNRADTKKAEHAPVPKVEPTTPSTKQPPAKAQDPAVSKSPTTKPVKPATKEGKTTTVLPEKKTGKVTPLPAGKSVAYNQTFFDKKSVTKLIATAKKYIGVPYQFGGTTPKAFDCSGYLQYVFRENGFAIPRLADEQYKLGRSTKSKKELEPGDLVFFETYEKGASHCGIYLGKDEFIHASTSKGVRIDKLTDSYWQPRYYGGKKISK